MTQRLEDRDEGKHASAKSLEGSVLVVMWSMQEGRAKEGDVVAQR
jgi:hypothetical protein